MVKVEKCPICGNGNISPKISSRDYTVSGETFTINSCSKCELLITSPRPSDNDLKSYYISDNYISHTSKAQNLTDWLYLIARKFTLQHKLSLISKFTRRGKILDYGCGTGDFLSIASKKNWEAFGVEPSLQARKRTNLTIVNSLEEISTQGFNAITLWHVLEHIPDLNHTLRQLRQKLSNDGTIFIAVPNYESFDAKYYNEFWAAYDVPRHLWHFNKKAMAKLLEQNALQLLSVKPMKLDSIYVSQLSEKYLRDNKSSLIGFLKGSLTGLQSNIKASKNNEYSSLIYVVKK